MQSFKAYLERKHARREIMHNALRAITSSHELLGEQNAARLRRMAAATHITEGLTDMIERRFESPSELGPRSRR